MRGKSGDGSKSALLPLDSIPRSWRTTGEEEINRWCCKIEGRSGHATASVELRMTKSPCRIAASNHNVAATTSHRIRACMSRIRACRMTSAQPQERYITLYRNLGVLSASHNSIDAIQSDVLHSSLQTSCAYVHVRLTFPARFRHPSVPAMLSVISLTATTRKAS